MFCLFFSLVLLLQQWMQKKNTNRKDGKKYKGRREKINNKDKIVDGKIKVLCLIKKKIEEEEEEEMKNQWCSVCLCLKFISLLGFVTHEEIAL